MRIKDLGTRPAPASIRELFSRVVRGQSPAVPVKRRQVPYWQERGWMRQGNIYTGSYHTPYAAFQGWIEQNSAQGVSIFIFTTRRRKSAAIATGPAFNTGETTGI